MLKRSRSKEKANNGIDVIEENILNLDNLQMRENDELEDNSINDASIPEFKNKMKLKEINTKNTITTTTTTTTTTKKYKENTVIEVDGRKMRQVGQRLIEEYLFEPDSDSSEDENPVKNTIGNVPLEWYAHEEHIGYDLDGKKIIKKERKDRLDRLIERMDKDGLVTTIYDEYNDEEVEITREQLRMLLNIKKGKYPDKKVDPFQEYYPWFSSVKVDEPLLTINLNSKTYQTQFELEDDKKIKILIKGYRSGTILTEAQRDKLYREEREKAQKPYDIWLKEEDKYGGYTKHLQPRLFQSNYVPAPKKEHNLGHELSYNPPVEYLLTEDEVDDMLRENEKIKNEGGIENPIPKMNDSLRKVEAYNGYIDEVFHRCLDLYLCPRMAPSKSKRISKDEIDIESLMPKIPKTKDLQPFPSIKYLEYIGHEGKVTSISIDVSGTWLVSGSEDGTIKLWEIMTCRNVHTWSYDTPVTCVSWCPRKDVKIIGATLGFRAVLIHANIGDEKLKKESKKLLKIKTENVMIEKNSDVLNWKKINQDSIELNHQSVVKEITWHHQGDYFATLLKHGEVKSIMIHRLSKKVSQFPFKKMNGRIISTKFHPTRPFFIIQLENTIKIYDLIKQMLIKKLYGERSEMQCLAIHPNGDNILSGSSCAKLLWYDMDLSIKPYKSLSFHKKPITMVDFHKLYPLFASASDDGTVQVFHGKVFDDLNKNPLIIPVKILKNHHKKVLFNVITDCKFHPLQPWLFTAGADKKIYLYCN